MNIFTKVKNKVKKLFKGRGQQQPEVRPNDPLDRTELQEQLVDPTVLAQQIGNLGGDGGLQGGGRPGDNVWNHPRMQQPRGDRFNLGRHRVRQQQDEDSSETDEDDTLTHSGELPIIEEDGGVNDLLVNNDEERESSYDLQDNPGGTDYIFNQDQLFEEIYTQREDLIPRERGQTRTEDPPVIEQNIQEEDSVDETIVNDEEDHDRSYDLQIERRSNDYTFKQGEWDDDPYGKKEELTPDKGGLPGTEELPVHVDTPLVNNEKVSDSPNDTQLHDGSTNYTFKQGEWDEDPYGKKEELTPDKGKLPGTEDIPIDVDTPPVNNEEVSGTQYELQTNDGSTGYNLQQYRTNKRFYAQKEESPFHGNDQKKGITDYFVRSDDSSDDSYAEKQEEGVTLPIQTSVDDGELFPSPVEEERLTIDQNHQAPLIRHSDPGRLAEMDRWDKLGRSLQNEGQVSDLSNVEPSQSTPVQPKQQRSWAWKNKITNQRETKPLLTKSLEKDYVGEDRGQSKAEKSNKLMKSILDIPVTSTYYAEDSEEFSTSAKKGKKKQDGTFDHVLAQHGKVVHSTDMIGDEGKIEEGNRAMYQKDKDERVNYAMDGSGELFTSNPIVETMRQLDIIHNVGQRHNHSSLVGGKDISSAGTLKVRQGKVEELADNSGHYKPSLIHTKQGVDHLQQSGVMDEQRSTVRLSAKRGDRDLLMSGTEFSSWGERIDQSRDRFKQTGDALELGKPEQEIRALHGQKDSMQRDLSRVDSILPNFEPNPKPNQIIMLGNHGKGARIDPKISQGVVEEPTMRPSKVKELMVHEQRRRRQQEELDKQRKLEREERDRKREEKKNRNNK